jgi:hypothetical protein
MIRGGLLSYSWWVRILSRVHHPDSQEGDGSSAELYLWAPSLQTQVLLRDPHHLEQHAASALPQELLPNGAILTQLMYHNFLFTFSFLEGQVLNLFHLCSLVF